MKKNVLFVLYIILSFNFIACSNDSESWSSNDDPALVKIIGKWKENDNNSTSWFFLNGGVGYKEYTKYDDGVYRRSFEWNLENDILSVEYNKDDYYSNSIIYYVVSYDSEGNMTLADVKTNKRSNYIKINNIGTTTVKYNNPPFVNYVRIYGYYYELSKAIMKCDHGISTMSNSKDLMFFGANELLSPIGVRFMYFTPYYEGINKEWSDGTYTISSKSGHWVYGGVYTYRGSESDRCSGKLKIKTVGNMKYLDFTLDNDDVIGHFQGYISYN